MDLGSETCLPHFGRFWPFGNFQISDGVMHGVYLDVSCADSACGICFLVHCSFPLLLYSVSACADLTLGAVVLVPLPLQAAARMTVNDFKL